MHWCVNDIPDISHISLYQVYGLFESTIQKTHSKVHYEDVLHLIFTFGICVYQTKSIKKEKKKNKKKDHLMHSLIIMPIKPHQKDRSCVQEGLRLT